MSNSDFVIYSWELNNKQIEKLRTQKQKSYSNEYGLFPIDSNQEVILTNTSASNITNNTLV